MDTGNDKKLITLCVKYVDRTLLFLSADKASVIPWVFPLVTYPTFHYN